MDWQDKSAQHIGANLETYEHTRTGFFSFIVEGLDNLLKTDFALEEPEDSDKIKNGQDVLKFTVVQASVPHFSLNTIETRRGNSVVKFAGVPTFQEGEIVIEDYIGLDSKSVIMAWQALAYDVNTDKGGRAVNYKKNCQLIEYTQDFTPIRSWDLIGCWVQEISEDPFNKNEDGERKITAKIQYDRAILHSEINNK